MPYSPYLSGSSLAAVPKCEFALAFSLGFSPTNLPRTLPHRQREVLHHPRGEGAASKQERQPVRMPAKCGSRAVDQYS